MERKSKSKSQSQSQLGSACGYWQEILLLLIIVASLAVHFLMYAVVRWGSFSQVGRWLSLAYSLEGFILLLAFAAALVFWVGEVGLILLDRVMISRWKYPPLKTLTKIFGIPALIALTFLVAVPDIESMKFDRSEAALLKCAGNPSSCREDDHIGWLRVHYIWKAGHNLEGEGTCVFFVTEEFFGEAGYVYVPDGKEACVQTTRYMDSITASPVKGNWWKYSGTVF